MKIDLGKKGTRLLTVNDNDANKSAVYKGETNTVYVEEMNKFYKKLFFCNGVTFNVLSASWVPEFAASDYIKYSDCTDKDFTIDSILFKNIKADRVEKYLHKENLKTSTVYGSSTMHILSGNSTYPNGVKVTFNGNIETEKGGLQIKCTSSDANYMVLAYGITGVRLPGKPPAAQQYKGYLY